MSFVAIKSVYELREKMTPKAKSALVALAYHQNKDSGQCNPSMDLLSLETSMSRISIVRGIAELVQKGLVVRLKKGGITQGPNCYKLNLKIADGGTGPCQSRNAQESSSSVSIDDIEGAFEGVAS
jgi:Helix-turn-helix domain